MGNFDHAGAKLNAFRAGLLVLNILAVAVVLRVVGLSHETPWNDEVLSIRYIDAPDFSTYADLVFTNDDAVRHVPVYFFVQYHWAQFFGESVYTLRLLSVTCFALSLPFLYLIGARLYDRLAGVYAAALYALALPHIYFAQEIRMYALTTLLVTISVYVFIRAVQGGRMGWWFCHALVNAVLLWTHVFGPLIWIAQGAFLVFFRRKQRLVLAGWLAWHGLLCFLFLFWLWYLDYGIKAHYVDQSTPTYREFLNAFNVYAGGRFGKLNPRLYLPTGVSFDRVLTVILGFLLIAAGMRAYRLRFGGEEEHFPGEKKRAWDGFVFAFLWLTAPPLFLFLESQIWKPLFLFRYTLYSSLAWYVIAGVALASLSSLRARFVLSTLIAAIFIHQLAVVGLPFRPDYKGVDEYVQENGSSSDVVLVFKEFNGVAYRYNSTLETERIEVYQGLSELVAAADDASEHAENVWVVVWRWDALERLETLLVDQGLTLVRRRFPGVPPLYLYRLREPKASPEPFFALRRGIGFMAAS